MCKKKRYEHKKIILAFAASAMLAGGCTSLDMDPVSDITDLNYWKTPEQFDSFVLDCIVASGAIRGICFVG